MGSRDVMNQKRELKREKFEAGHKLEKKIDKYKYYLIYYRWWISLGIFIGILVTVLMKNNFIINKLSHFNFDIDYNEGSITLTITLSIALLFLILLAVVLCFWFCKKITLLRIMIISVSSLFTYLICYLLGGVIPESAKIFGAFATLIVGILAYHYTTSNNHRQLIDSLDAKSGWRKSLFDLASKREIDPEDIQVLRTTLRFDYKEKPENYFELMTKLIILYCEGVEQVMSNSHSQYLNKLNVKVRFNIEFNIKPDDKININTKFDPRIARLFARYLLADHWEKNLQDTKDRTTYLLFEELSRVSESEFKVLYEMIEKNDEPIFNKLSKPFLESNFIKNLDTNYNYIKKENELFIYTIQKFIEYSR